MKKFLASLLVAAPMLANANNFLPADQAFDFGYQINGDKVVLIWNVAQDYHMYKDKIKFYPEGSVKVDFWPKGKIKDDGFYGEQELYSGQVILKGTVERSFNEKVFVTYQGCKLNELCYMPQRKEIK